VGTHKLGLHLIFMLFMEQNMQEFMSHSKASDFVKLCMRDIAAANPAREQQGPAAHTRAGGSMV
jgi:hypothetical protein